MGTKLRCSGFRPFDVAQDMVPSSELGNFTLNFERLRTVWRVVASAIVLFFIGCGKSAPPQPPPPEVEVVQDGADSAQRVAVAGSTLQSSRGGWQE